MDNGDFLMKLMRNFYLLIFVVGMFGALGACGFIDSMSLDSQDNLSISAAQIASGKLPACNPALLVTTDQVFDTLYAITRNSTLDVIQLRIIDPKTAQTIARKTLSSADGIMDRANGLAADPITGTLYAIVRFEGMGGIRSLVTLDPIAGSAHLVGNLGDSFAEITFDACGRLFGVTGDGANNPETLYLIDKNNASITWLRALGNGGDGEVIAMNPYTDTLYHASGFLGFGGIFETVNINDGTTSNIPISGDDPIELNSLTIGLGGAGFYATNINGSLLNISTLGFSVDVGRVDDLSGFSEKTQGLAFAPATIPTGDPETPPASGGGGGCC
jgi:hypothetical protein